MFAIGINLSPLTVLFIGSHLLRIWHCQADCIPKAPEVNRGHPFWSMRAFENLQYTNGFPIDFMGGIISQFMLNTTKCTGDLTTANKRACNFANIPQYCHFGMAQLSSLRDTSGNVTCPGSFLPDWSAQPKMNPPPKDLSSLQILTLKTARRLGENPPEWDPSFDQWFKDCADCEDMVNIGGIYLCNYTNYLQKFQYRTADPRIVEWDKSQQNLFSLYVYKFCTITWKLFIKTNSRVPRIHPFCPNPCSVRLGPCSKVENVIPPLKTPVLMHSVSESNCIVIGDGFYEGQYECLCRKGYFWNKDSKTCMPHDFCALNEAERRKNSSIEPICSEAGTLRCISFPPPETESQGSGDDSAGKELAPRYACVCRGGYMGPKCERLRDPCIESSKPGSVAGEQACRTYLGNKCTPHNGTDYYFCKCAENWVHDSTFPFPNCYKRRSICDRVICHNRGRCVSSSDQRAFLCLCEYGWHGRLCELPDVRHWLPWGPWTLCSAPLCGGRGWHSRTRECRVPVNNVTGLGQCQGNSVEFRPCRSGCPDPVRSYVPMIKLIIFFGCCLLTLQASVGFIYLLLKMEYL
ncbi:hypothetical protein CSKR_108199 [Clonorchis sinensis]|uniref:EGF-like domain-containing protein n=1 Tax=Clonorchis sinensis TaxID=79923 RepID=A0A8T1LTI7_CLOSI|nr:hypothetical protein CSKR_108199 [Clonorchis sinensis]